MKMHWTSELAKLDPCLDALEWCKRMLPQATRNKGQIK